MANAFTADAGRYQGRITPTNYRPASGAYAYCLGHDLPRQLFPFMNGDQHNVSQTIDATGFDLVTLSVHIRAPSSMPVGTEWLLVVSAFGVDYVSSSIAVGSRERTIVDIAVPAWQSPTNVNLQMMLYFGGPSGDLIEDVELPGVYVDNVSASVADAQIVITAHDPPVGDTNVAPDETIQFTVVDVAGVPLTDVFARVDNRLVARWVGTGAFTPSFVAPGWTVLAVPLDIGITSYRLTRAIPFTSEKIVVVEVTATNADSFTRAFSWIYTVADTAGPRLIAAAGTGVREVRLTWNEAVSDTALVADAYTLALESAPPGFVPEILDVERAAPDAIVLVLDQPLTPGATYRVIVAGSVEDVNGNAIAAPDDTLTFVPFVSDLTPSARVVSLYRELPEAERESDESGELELMCGVLDELYRMLVGMIDEWPNIVADPDTATEPFLDLMLAELGNPFGWLDLTVEQKRLLVRMLLEVYASKGSGPGIVGTVRLLLGLNVRLHVYAWAPAALGDAIIGDSWILGSSTQADLYTFEVRCERVLTAQERHALDLVVDYMKVAHEHHRIVEPTEIVVLDHWQLGFSHLGSETLLHS